MGLFNAGLPFGDMSGRGISNERLVRPFAKDTSVLPSPPRPPKVVVGEPEDIAEPAETPGLLAWGASGTPSPIEDMEADKFLSDKVEGKATSSHEDFTVTGLKKKSTNKKAPQDKRPGIISADEIDRQTITFKVYNPDDAEQWVKVQAVKSIRLRLSDTDQRQTIIGSGGKGKDVTVQTSNLSGKILKLNLRPPPPPLKPAT
jgi:hypothetical protein